MKFVEKVRIEHVENTSVGVVDFTQPMECLSCAVLGGGLNLVRHAFIMQVPKNYATSDPRMDADRVRIALGLPEDTIGMMTAAEVDYVFNAKNTVFEDSEVTAFATAGLSNHTIAGEDLIDYPEKHEISLRRHNEMVGTINIGVISPIPLTTAGMVNFLTPLVEAKSVAMSEHGFMETGTTSDAMAVFCPPGEERRSWAGTGSTIGIAAARAVEAAVGHALEMRNEHPMPLTTRRILDKLGLGAEDLRNISGTDKNEESFETELKAILDDDNLSSAMDIAWFAKDRLDSIAQDGNDRELLIFLEWFSEILGVEPPAEGGTMDSIIRMIAKKAGQ